MVNWLTADHRLTPLNDVMCNDGGSTLLEVPPLYSLKGIYMYNVNCWRKAQKHLLKGRFASLFLFVYYRIDTSYLSLIILQYP